MAILAFVAACGIAEPDPTALPKEPEPQDISALLQRVAGYQVSQLQPIEEQGASWRLCTFYIGALAASRATDSSYYHTLALRWAQANGWRIRANRSRRVDFQCIAQVFLELYLQDRASQQTEGIRCHRGRSAARR